MGAADKIVVNNKLGPMAKSVGQLYMFTERVVFLVKNYSEKLNK